MLSARIAIVALVLTLSVAACSKSDDASKPSSVPPLALTVEIQPIGRGTQHDVKGLCGKPEASRAGS